MLKIATHDSITGEKSTWYSWILIPFARTQSKTIKEQYENGCRLFDLRMKKVFGKWKMAHGFFYIKKSVDDIFSELNSFEDTCRATITYEGGYEHIDEFIEYVKALKEKYNKVKYGPIAIKHGKNGNAIVTDYDYILKGDDHWLDAPTQSKFIPLNGRTWQSYIPIPWLWKKIYYDKPIFTEDKYTYVDFL